MHGELLLNLIEDSLIVGYKKKSSWHQSWRLFSHSWVASVIIGYNDGYSLKKNRFKLTVKTLI